MSFLERSLSHIIEDQPIALIDTANWMRRRLNELVRVFDGVENVYLVGCGDSYFVAIYGALLFERFTNLQAQAFESYEFWKYKSNIWDKSVLVAISASGKTSKTIEAAKYAKEKGLKILAVTNNASSPLAIISDLCIETQVAKPFGPPSATSTTAMLSLNMLSRELGGVGIDNVEPLIKWIGSNICALLEQASKDAEILVKKSYAYLVGAGPGFVSALFGGAKLREAAWLHSIPFEAEEFSHYGMISVDQGDIVFLNAFKGESISKMRALSEALNNIGAETVILTNDTEKRWGRRVVELPQMDESDTAIIATIYYQILAIATARKKKLPVTGFRYSKILSQLIGYY
ncbi:MAG: SIS domain-containing protein [Candidatus Njordarchaeales archaeon]